MPVDNSIGRPELPRLEVHLEGNYLISGPMQISDEYHTNEISFSQYSDTLFQSPHQMTSCLAFSRFRSTPPFSVAIRMSYTTPQFPFVSQTQPPHHQFFSILLNMSPSIPSTKRQKREDYRKSHRENELTELPKKKFYRQRAHANPFSDHQLS